MELTELEEMNWKSQIKATLSKILPCMRKEMK
jgi:hypothetical protein